MQTDNSSEFFVHRTRTAISNGENSQSKIKRFFHSLLISHVSRWKSIFDFFWAYMVLITMIEVFKHVVFCYDKHLKEIFQTLK